MGVPRFEPAMAGWEAVPSPAEPSQIGQVQRLHRVIRLATQQLAWSSNRQQTHEIGLERCSHRRQSHNQVVITAFLALTDFCCSGCFRFVRPLPWPLFRQFLVEWSLCPFLLPLTAFLSACLDFKRLFEALDVKSFRARAFINQALWLFFASLNNQLFVDNVSTMLALIFFLHCLVLSLSHSIRRLPFRCLAGAGVRRGYYDLHLLTFICCSLDFSAKASKRTFYGFHFADSS